jgi:predicted double-glycine peptidase
MWWLSLLVTFQQALWIDLPFIHQDKNGCGSASIWMVMEYWKPTATASIEDIQQQLYSKDAGGIYTRDMVRYLEAHGYRVFTFRGEWSDLERHIVKGRPLIVCLERNSRGVPLHYVVVAGVDTIQNLVLLNDPAQRKLLSMSRVDFERSWRATENWTLLAVPEVDLASAAFREDKLSEAREHLSSALRSDPSNTYTNDFLATVYFLENNNEAALRYWNRVGKPKVENIRIDPPLQTDPILLDHTFTFSRGSILRLEDFERTQARLNSLHIFSRYRMELAPRDDQNFDITFRAMDRRGFHPVSWLRGLPFQAVEPEFINIRGKALNVSSIVRWDKNKRRANIAIEAPLRGDPRWGIRVGIDGRRENWLDSSDNFQMRKIEASAEFYAVPSGRWTWKSGATVSNRRFSDSQMSGLGLKYVGSATRTLMKDLDRQVRLDSSLVVEAGKLFLAGTPRFGKVHSDLFLHWRGLTSGIRMGRTFGQLPFDEQFVLGVEHDSDLWVRGHSATVDGRKNAASVSRKFVVTNLDFQTKVFDTGWFGLNAGPFLDTAKAPAFSRWVIDGGLQVRFNILHTVEFAMSLGRSFRDGQHAFFLSGSK